MYYEFIKATTVGNAIKIFSTKFLHGDFNQNDTVDDNVMCISIKNHDRISMLLK